MQAAHREDRVQRGVGGVVEDRIGRLVQGLQVVGGLPEERITSLGGVDSSEALILLTHAEALLAVGSRAEGRAALIAGGSMLADITDEHELETRRRQEGIFFGSLSFSGKASAGIGNWTLG